jgi:LuxR family maltose regulon positive regulatory protein
MKRSGEMLDATTTPFGDIAPEPAAAREGSGTRGRAAGGTAVAGDYPVIEANLAPPRLPSHLVLREALLERLVGRRPERVVSVLAPAGYGKTTLLAQWRSRESRPVAWLTLSRLESDPIRLLTGITMAIDRAVSLDTRLIGDIFGETSSALSSVIPRLATALHARDPELVLMLDDVNMLSGASSLDALDMLIDYLPPHVDIALAGRHDPGLALARLAASGRLLEITAKDLALDEAEARMVAGQGGAGLADDLVRELHRKTEGWPAALYLAARAHRADGDRAAIPSVERDVAPYLDAELLGDTPRDVLDFMARTAILDTMTGPLCDAVTGRTDSAELLERLAAQNGLIVMVDTDGAWYRYHSLLREHLVTLLRRSPWDVGVLHRRAADWLLEHEALEPAVEHLLAVDADAAAEAIAGVILGWYRAGRSQTVIGWLQRLPEAVLRRHPYLAITAAWIDLIAGRADEGERLAAVVETWGYGEDRTQAEASFEAVRLSLRAMLARRGLQVAIDDAERAITLEPRSAPWRSTSLSVLGALLAIDGQARRADSVLADAVTLARTQAAGRAQAIAAAERAVLAIERDDWRSAAALIGEAVSVIEGHRLDPDSITACVSAVAARVTIRQNDVAGARAHLATFVTTKPTLTSAMPWLSVRYLLQAALAHLALADPAGARTVLWQAEDIIRRRPDLGDLPDRVAALRARIRRLPPGASGASTLTPAEIRVLRLLPTYLSIPEIADRLTVAPSTVRTQVQAIFGKLGASSRAEAVEAAVDAGLLEPLPVLSSPVLTA